MMVCPVCETKASEGQEYCLNCAWEFEYFFDELTNKEQEIYESKLSIRKGVDYRLIDEFRRIELNLIEIRSERDWFKQENLRLIKEHKNIVKVNDILLQNSLNASSKLEEKIKSLTSSNEELLFSNKTLKGNLIRLGSIEQEYCSIQIKLDNLKNKKIEKEKNLIEEKFLRVGESSILPNDEFKILPKKKLKSSRIFSMEAVSIILLCLVLLYFFENMTLVCYVAFVPSSYIFYRELLFIKSGDKSILFPFAIIKVVSLLGLIYYGWTI